MCREHLANLLKEHCLVNGGDTNVTQWLKEEGTNASLTSILKARLHLTVCVLGSLCLCCLWAQRMSPGWSRNTRGHVRGVQALDDAKSGDLLFWASRYHLFVSWSPDGSHPWDSLPAAGQHATLEIGSLRGSPDKARPFLCCLHAWGCKCAIPAEYAPP